jgi:hypothetical protein
MPKINAPGKESVAFEGAGTSRSEVRLTSSYGTGSTRPAAGDAAIARGDCEYRIVDAGAAAPSRACPQSRIDRERDGV